MWTFRITVAGFAVLLLAGAVGVVRVTAQQSDEPVAAERDQPDERRPATPAGISAQRTVHSDFAEGAITLAQPASPFDDKGVKTVTMGTQLEFECRFYIDDFFDKSIIWAGANITNPTSTPMFFEYNVAFFDSEGKLIGCAAQGSYGGVEPGESTQLGSCLITLQQQDIARVRRYQVRVYESTREVGLE